MEVLLAGVRVDVCHGGCGGVWFDNFEMQRVAQKGAEAESALCRLEVSPACRVDTHRKRSCPRCPDIKLRRHFYTPSRRVQVDECPGCGGYWLDAGELSLVRQEMNASSQEKTCEEATVSSEFIRYLYRLSTNDRPTL